MYDISSLLLIPSFFQAEDGIRYGHVTGVQTCALPIATAAAFLARAKVWFAAHGISHIHRVVTDNGACYRSGDFERIVGSHTKHQKTKPYTPRHNGKVERYQRILAEELLYAREFSSEDARSTAIAVWNIHYNYHRPHSGAGGRPPASRLRTGVTNVQPSYT